LHEFGFVGVEAGEEVKPLQAMGRAVLRRMAFLPFSQYELLTRHLPDSCQSTHRLADILTVAQRSLTVKGMSSLKEFQCEICRIVSENPIHWFVIECGDQKLAVIKWDLTAASSPTARHFCGEAHAQVYISRWFESICLPPKSALRVS
jgi:hypothetical protein